MPSDPIASLGEFVTASEAEALAVQFASGQHTVKALSVVNAARRGEAKRLLAGAGLSHEDGERAAGVLRAIAGAKSLNRDLTPVWTMPGNEAKIGHLTGEFHRLVRFIGWPKQQGEPAGLRVLCAEHARLDGAPHYRLDQVQACRCSTPLR